jgi:hypothetical protein
MIKIGLLIQGPIISKGLEGKNMGIPYREILEKPEIYQTNYDCSQNINKIINTYNNYFDSIVLSTWEYEDLTKIDVSNKKITISINSEKNMLQNYADYNKYRQFYLCTKGLEILHTKNCKYFLKIRTDQYFDISIIFSIIDKLINNEYKIGIVGFKKNDFEFIHDFYFFSKTSTTLKIFNDYLVSKEIFKIVHKDIFYNFSFLYSNKSYKINYSKPFYNKSSFQKKLIVKCWSHFYCLPKDILDSLYWRGSKVNDCWVSNYYEMSNTEISEYINKMYIAKYFFFFPYIIKKLVNVFYKVKKSI